MIETPRRRSASAKRLVEDQVVEDEESQSLASSSERPTQASGSSSSSQLLWDGEEYFHAQEVSLMLRAQGKQASQMCNVSSSSSSHYNPDQPELRAPNNKEEDEDAAEDPALKEESYYDFTNMKTPTFWDTFTIRFGPTKAPYKYGPYAPKPKKKSKGRSRRKQTAQHQQRLYCVYTVLILICGAIASCAFLVLGIAGADRDQARQFQSKSTELVNALQEVVGRYQMSALWIHESCSDKGSRGNNDNATSSMHPQICSRLDFFDLYQYLIHSEGGQQEAAVQEATTTAATSSTALVSEDQIVAVQFIPQISQEQRKDVEQESAAFYDQYLPDWNYEYLGLVQWTESEEMDRPGLHPGLNVQRIPRPSPQPFYYPMHHVAPLSNSNKDRIDLDVASLPALWDALQRAVHDKTFTISQRLHYSNQVGFYHLQMFHPGIPLEDPESFFASANRNDEDNPNRKLVHEEDPHAVAGMEISVVRLLQQVMEGVPQEMTMYLYDKIHADDLYEDVQHYRVAQFDKDGFTYQFLGGLIVDKDNQTAVPDDDFSESEIKDRRRLHQDLIEIANHQWVVYVTAADGSYEAKIILYILGASLIMVACIFVAFWYSSTIQRNRTVNRMKAYARSQKSKMMLKSSQEAVRAERDLNDFLAHEVRNPLSAALTASSFVAAELHAEPPHLLATEESRNMVRDDLGVIQQSLQFINDLLRSILDFHRAASRQLTIDLAPTDLRADVLEPVATMLYQRRPGVSYHGDGEAPAVEILVDCPPDGLVVLTDRLRLKQVIMNLATNARKFVHHGFIKLSARVVEEDGNQVELSVEDSGPGIPEAKRKQLFQKYQESLDSLAQGTGIGLSLCKQISSLLGGELRLDEDYDSGVADCPGARFIVALNTEPINSADIEDDEYGEHAVDGDETNNVSLSQLESGVSPTNKKSSRVSFSDSMSAKSSNQKKIPTELPRLLKVLFVDDDFVLRKLFVRSLKRAAPEWNVSQASNGETALRMADSETYDIIFMDQYMASVQKQLLGTETTRELRSMGVRSTICGLSANDMEGAFLKAGANCFMMKPFPCEADALKDELLRVLYRPRIESEAIFRSAKLLQAREETDNTTSRTDDSSNEGHSSEKASDKAAEEKADRKAAPESAPAVGLFAPVLSSTSSIQKVPVMPGEPSSTTSNETGPTRGKNGLFATLGGSENAERDSPSTSSTCTSTDPTEMSELCQAAESPPTAIKGAEQSDSKVFSPGTSAVPMEKGHPTAASGGLFALLDLSEADTKSGNAALVDSLSHGESPQSVPMDSPPPSNGSGGLFAPLGQA